MSTVQLCILAGGSLITNSFANNVRHTGTSLGSYSGTVTVNSDGTTSGSFVSNTSNWYTPTSAGIGAQFWVKLTTSNISMVTVTGSLSGGGWVQLASTQSATFANSGTGNEGTGNYTIQFATDSGGANITGTISGSIDVGYTTLA